MFRTFKADVAGAFQKMIIEGDSYVDQLFVVNVGPDELWEAYLNSFANAEERQQHNCNNCKSFIRHYGKVVSIDPVTYEMKTFWDDVHTPGFEQTAQALAEIIKNHAVCNIFLLDTAEEHGCDHNVQHLEDGTCRTWYHLYVDIPAKFKFNSYGRSSTKGSELSTVVAAKEVLTRSVLELKLDAIDIVIDLIEEGNLYRGSEFLKSLQEFRRIYVEAQQTRYLNNYCWLHCKSNVAKFRNTAMGTLLIDLSEGKDLEESVRAYERIMAPTNYKRPTAVITKKQIAAAQKKVEELGLIDALPRRHARVEDISVNDVLFVNRDVRKKMKGDVFEDLLETLPTKAKQKGNAKEITVQDFLKNVLPKASNIEVLFGNEHISNLVTLTAPQNADAGNLFKWNNNFAWVYNGSVADSFKEKVKKAGGNVEGFMRASLHWFNGDDLDIHCKQPSGIEIFYGNKQGTSGGCLDIDMNAGGPSSRDAVENIIWTDPSKLQLGRYEIYVNNFYLREHIDVGFEVEIEVFGELYKFYYDKMVEDCENIKVAYIDVKNTFEIKVVPVMECKTNSRPQEVWGITTTHYISVSCIMFSPNYWEGNAVGNKHLFFMLKGCINPDPVRGFFNEYLRADLERDHRKVFEAIGSRAKTEFDSEQLSGLGFSLTKANELIVKVDNVDYKLKF